MDNNLVADPAGPLSYNTLRKKYSGWHVSNFEDAIKRVSRPSELDELRIAIKYFLSKEDAIRLSESVSARLNELSDRLISFGDFLMAYKNGELAFKEMRDRCVKRGNDWVCASYMSQIDFFINRQATDRSKGGRRPLNDMLGKVREGYDLVKLLEEKWTEFQDKEQIPGFIEEEIHDIFKGLLAREIGPDRFWASMDIRSEVEGRPIITPAKKMELIELWVKHGIMLPAQKHIAKPEKVTMPMPPSAPMEPIPMEEVRRVIRKEEDLDKRIEELRKKKELERQREKERQEREKETGKPPAKPIQPLPAAPAVSPELDLMKDEIEKRIAEMMRRKRVGEGQAGEPAARYGIKKKEVILQVTGTESRYSGSGSEWLKTPVSVSIEKDQNTQYLIYRRGAGKEERTYYHTKTYGHIYTERYQSPFGYTVEIRFVDDMNRAIKLILDPGPNPKFINGVILEDGRKIATFDVDESSFRKAEQFARENKILKDAGGGYRINERYPESPEGIGDDTPPQEDIKSWAVWMLIVDYVQKNGLKKWLETEYASHLKELSAEELKLLRKLIEDADDLTASERSKVQEKIEQRLTSPMRDKDISKMSYAELHFLVNTEQDADELKRFHARIDSLPHLTDFDKELLKEQILQRMQRIVEAEEFTKPGVPELPEKTKTPEKYIKPNWEIVGEPYKNWTYQRFKESISKTYSLIEMSKLIAGIRGSDKLVFKERRELLDSSFERFKTLKGGPVEGFAEGAANYTLFMERTWDKEKRGKQKDILRSLYPDYDPKRHDSFVDRYNKEVDKRRMDNYLEARKIKDPSEQGKEFIGKRAKHSEFGEVLVIWSNPEKNRALIQFDDGDKQETQWHKLLFPEADELLLREQKRLDNNYDPVGPDIKKDNRTPLELEREKRLKQYPTEEAFRTAKTKYADFLETDFHLKSYKTKAEMYKPNTIQYNKHMAAYKERLKEIADLRREAAAGKTIWELRYEDAERDAKEYEAEREARQQKLAALRSESYEALLTKAKSFNTIWGDEGKAWKDRYTAKDEVKDIISILKERNIDIIPILNDQLHELQAKNNIKEHNMDYRIGELDTTYNIDIVNIKKIKLAAACGVKKIWVTNKGREGVILAAKYGTEWWEKASQDDIERIIVYETNADYELSDTEYTKASKMSFDELISNNICPECKHKMVSGKCLLHGTREQILSHQPRVTSCSELSIVETNLLNVGYNLRNDGRGHMVLPNGKGVSPTNHRGIVNHWEVIVDAGYLPISNIFKLKHSPDSIVAGAINKGWRRWSGEASYEIRDLSKPNVDFINMRLKQHFDSSGGMYEAHIDVWSEGKYYNFDKKMWDKSNRDILQVIKKIPSKLYQPAKALELTLMETENEYLIRDPASIGDPDVWAASKGAAFMDDIRGAHHGQVDGTLVVYDTKTSITIGYIDYSIFEGKLYLNSIEVDTTHRRQGYATALLLKLKKLNPGTPVKWGMMTELGCALKNAVDKESPNPSGVKVVFKGVLGEKHEKYGTICDRLKKMDEFEDLIMKVSSESKQDKIERSFDICENDNASITFSTPRQGHESCIDYCDTCPPRTKKINEVHTHPAGLVNPSVGDYINSINNNQKMFCIVGNDPYKNNILTVKCYSIPEYLFTEKDTVKKHNKIAELVRTENSICMIRYQQLARTSESGPETAGLVTRNMTCYKCGEMLQRKLNADQKTITCPSCQTQIEISSLSKEERIRLAKKIAGGETEVRSTVVRGDDALDVKEKCSEWDFGTFEVMLSGAETQDELEGMLDCLNVSKILSESEIDTMRKLIETKMEE